MGVGGAAQVLRSQMRPRGQELVQEPQCLASDVRLKHPSWQLAWLAVQLTRQFPFWQDIPGEQTTPHRPQFLLSVRILVHWLLQANISEEQIVGFFTVGIVVIAVVSTVAVTGRSVVGTGVSVSVLTTTYDLATDPPPGESVVPGAGFAAVPGEKTHDPFIAE